MKNFLSKQYPEESYPNLSSTKPCFLFHEKNFRVNALWHYIIKMLTISDKVNEILIDTNENKPSPLDPDEYVKGRYKWRDEYDFHEPTIGEICFGRIADSFSIYLDDVLKYIFKKEPRLLASKEKITHEEIVKASSKEEILEHMANQKCQSISYSGITSRIRYLSENAGLDFSLNENHLKDISNIMEVRNILVHNGGTVNRIFVSRSKDTPFELGDQVTINTSMANNAASCLLLASRIIDQAVVEKFGGEIHLSEKNDFSKKMAEKYISESGKFSQDISNTIKEAISKAMDDHQD